MVLLSMKMAWFVKVPLTCSTQFASPTVAVGSFSALMNNLALNIFKVPFELNTVHQSTHTVFRSTVKGLLWQLIWSGSLKYQHIPLLISKTWAIGLQFLKCFSLNCFIEQHYIMQLSVSDSFLLAEERKCKMICTEVIQLPQYIINIIYLHCDCNHNIVTICHHVEASAKPLKFGIF